MATIKDIARLANVSIATVSNVLNEKSGAASIEKAQEIMKIAKELNYRPNSLAQNLKRRRTKTIGVITEDLTAMNTLEIVDGIDELCEENGYEMVVTNMRLYKRYQNDYADTLGHRRLFEEYTKNLLAKQVEGIIYVGYHSREIAYTPAMIDVDIPFVYSYCLPKGLGYPVVLPDNERASEQVIEHLLSLGHRKIGIISGPVTSENTQARLRGAQKALYNARMLYNAEFTRVGDWSKESGYRHAGPLLKRKATAIYAFNDRMASGVYQRCAECGLIIGKDIALFGYDDSEAAMELSPPLSTVRMPLNAMGKRSAQMILDRIGSGESAAGIHLLPCEVIIRESSSDCLGG